MHGLRPLQDCYTDGIDIEKGSDNWLQHADLVVLPAHVEHKPRRLLAAAAAGVHVVASKACGLDGIDGIETVDAGDPSALRIAVQRHLVPAASVLAV